MSDSIPGVFPHACDPSIQSSRARGLGLFKDVLSHKVSTCFKEQNSKPMDKKGNFCQDILHVCLGENIWGL